jgi:ATP-dependent DNA helicase RecG
MISASELLKQLNTLDECANIEAKLGSFIDKSVMETVCAFSNEPGLGGGHILIGVKRDDAELFAQYQPVSLVNIDQLQQDLASRCATEFNLPVRPEILVERINGRPVIKVFVPELQAAQKPLYFRSRALPAGAFRRIGSTDQQCGDDDMMVFYNHHDTFDTTVLDEASMADIDPEALKAYRQLRRNINALAEELNYGDEDLMISLGCAKKKSGKIALTIAGLMLFGKSAAQRRLFPMMRFDYVRVPGNDWVADPDNRFTTIDMRGPLILAVQRLFNAVIDDLPTGFLLPEDELQAQNTGLPGRVLREVLVNAIMHRSYKVQQPVQVIRYGNRIEIKNPGFSLKPEDQLGEPGSRTRNPFVAAVFHETNLAETKGSGIRTMRKLLEQAGLAPPTFESDHGANLFTARLLLHHFLNEEDLAWLKKFDSLSLNDNQKRALVFLREVGAIDNPAFRQLNGCDILRASNELRLLRDWGLLEQKGRGRSTYYIPTKFFNEGTNTPTQPASRRGALKAPENQIFTVSAPAKTPHSTPAQELVHQWPEALWQQYSRIGKRTNDAQQIQDFIAELCKVRDYKLQEIAAILDRQPKYILQTYLQPLMKAGLLVYTFPDMPNHPNQAYRSPA